MDSMHVVDNPLCSVALGNMCLKACPWTFPYCLTTSNRSVSVKKSLETNSMYISQLRSSWSLDIHNSLLKLEQQFQGIWRIFWPGPESAMSNPSITLLKMACGWFQWIQRMNCVYVLRTVIASWFVAWFPSDFNRVARSELPNLGC